METVDPTLVGMLESIAEDAPVISSPTSTDPEDEAIRLSKDDRMERVFDLRMRGIPAKVIARTLGVDPATVYRDLQEYYTKFKEELEGNDGVSIIAETLSFLTSIEDTLLYEFHATPGPDASEAVKVDPKTGLVKRERGAPNNNRVKIMDMVLRARNMKIDVLSRTGILPKDPERLYRTVKPTDEAEDKKAEDRTPDEIRQAVESLLKHGRRI